jgi:hypothetical protein
MPRRALTYLPRKARRHPDEVVEAYTNLKSFLPSSRMIHLPVTSNHRCKRCCHSYSQGKLVSHILARALLHRVLSRLGAGRGHLAEMSNLGERCLPKRYGKHITVKRSSKPTYCGATLIEMTLSCNKVAVHYASDPNLV